MVRPMMKGRRRPNREVQRSEAWPRSGCSQSDIAGFARNTKDAVEAGQNWSKNGSITTSPELQVNSTAAPMAEIATKVLSGGARCSASCSTVVGSQSCRGVMAARGAMAVRVPHSTRDNRPSVAPKESVLLDTVLVVVL